MNWIALTAENQLEAINQQSFLPTVKAVLVFKHSTRCGTSALALNRLERSFDLSSEELPAYFLDLLSYRELSGKIAAEYSIEHQSPQILLIKNGKCIFTASHLDISLAEIRSAIDQ